MFWKHLLTIPGIMYESVFCLESLCVQYHYFFLPVFQSERLSWDKALVMYILQTDLYTSLLNNNKKSWSLAINRPALV